MPRKGFAQSHRPPQGAHGGHGEADCQPHRPGAECPTTGFGARDPQVSTSPSTSQGLWLGQEEGKVGHGGPELSSASVTLGAGTFPSLGLHPEIRGLETHGPSESHLFPVSQREDRRLQRSSHALCT